MDIKNLPTSAGGEFPTVVIEKENKMWANIIQNLYASCDSETSGILGYIYQSYIIRPMEEEIANILEKIAMVEMRHHEQLGNLIVKLGGDPYFVNSRNMPFQIRCVKRTKNLKEMLLYDIKGEEEGILDYEKAINQIDNESIKALLERIKQDEIVHKNTLQTIYDYVSFYK